MKRSISYSVYTNIGGREINEDALGYRFTDGSYCFFLCDGLGGHGMGEVASSTAIKVFESQLEKSINAKDYICNAFQAAEDIILAEQKKKNAINKMKTTAAIVLIGKNKVHIGHIGDSRIYVFYRKRVVMRTLDHSVPQMLALSGEIKETEIRNHPSRNILLRVIGVEWSEPMYEVASPIPLRKVDALLLCSDGFWELIDESTMCALLEVSNSASEWLERMRHTVVENGKKTNMDNNSAIAIWID